MASFTCIGGCVYIYMEMYFTLFFCFQINSNIHFCLLLVFSSLFVNLFIYLIA